MNRKNIPFLQTKQGQNFPSNRLGIKRKYEFISSKQREFLSPGAYKILTSKEAGIITKDLKNLGKKVVLISGVFDLMHVGHLAVFAKARQYGDVLAVTTPTDEQIHLHKGHDRPITTLTDRLNMLSHIESVDFVFSQSSWSMIEVLREIKPTVYAYTLWSNSNHILTLIQQAQRFGIEIQVLNIDTSSISSSKLVALIEKFK